MSSGQHSPPWICIHLCGIWKWSKVFKANRKGSALAPLFNELVLMLKHFIFRLYLHNGNIIWFFMYHHCRV